LLTDGQKQSEPEFLELIELPEFCLFFNSVNPGSDNAPGIVADTGLAVNACAV
jgi:hypothetical protein